MERYNKRNKTIIEELKELFPNVLVEIITTYVILEMIDIDVENIFFKEHKLIKLCEGIYFSETKPFEGYFIRGEIATYQCKTKNGVILSFFARINGGLKIIMENRKYLEDKIEEFRKVYGITRVIIEQFGKSLLSPEKIMITTIKYSFGAIIRYYEMGKEEFDEFMLNKIEFKL